MVKFTKDGSTATSAALKLARAYTGRDMVGVCAEHPFFSYDDWFIATTTMDGGIPAVDAPIASPASATTTSPASSECSTTHPDQIAARVPRTGAHRAACRGFLEGLRTLCTDEWRRAGLRRDDHRLPLALHGAQELYGVVPDLSTFGKALANGFSLSALCGKREFMRLGSRERDEDDVFLLSTTHGAEAPALAAAIATMRRLRAASRSSSTCTARVSG